MTIDQAEELVYALELDGDVEDLVYPDYSGRFMYGKTTVGIVVDSLHQLVRLGYEARELDIPYNDLPKRIDNLGRDYIVY